MGVKVETLTPRAEEKKQPRISHVQEFKDELKKVTWTTRDELLLCTKVVVGATFALGIGIYLIDLGIKGVLDGFAGIIRLIFG